MACHNLYNSLTPPAKLQNLLGLGLNFCPRPRMSTSSETLSLSLECFRQDIHVKFVFSGSDEPWDPKQLFLQSDWEPDSDDLPAEFRARVSYFLRCLRIQFRNRRGQSNVFPYQWILLQTLRQNEAFIVVPTNKKLGPAIMERAQYIRRIHQDHLSDETTYCQLTKQEVDDAIETTHSDILALLNDKHSSFSDADDTFLRCSLSVKEPLAHFYALIKIHKKTIVTRPIISQSGCLLHGLASITHLPYSTEPDVRCGTYFCTICTVSCTICTAVFVCGNTTCYRFPYNWYRFPYDLYRRPYV
jgi:hypothetical protein